MKRSPRRFLGRHSGLWLAPALLIPCVTVPAADYDLDSVALSTNYPDDATATSRQFDVPRLNNSGQVLFKATWIDNGGTRHNVLGLGRGGGSSQVVVSGQPPLPGSDLVFENADNTGGRAINYLEYTLNADGTLLFNGNVVGTNGGTSSNAYYHAVWKGPAGDYGLVAGARSLGSTQLPPPADISNAAYSGTGTLEFSGVGTGLLLADNGKGFFLAGLEAAEPAGPNNYSFVDVPGGFVTSGLTNQRLVGYAGAAAPGLTGSYDFVSLSAVGFGQLDGVLVLQCIVAPVGDADPTHQRHAFYAFRNDALELIHLVGDPLPDLPPLDQVLGTSDPYDLRVDPVAVDGDGNLVLYIWASAVNTIDVRPIGYWKYTSAGLAKVLMFGEDVATPTGTVHLLTPSSTSTQRVAMGGGRLAYIGSFTGAGFNTPTPGIIREIEGGFEVIAANGMFANGTVQLSNDFLTANTPLAMNAAGEVAFVVSARASAQDPYRLSAWVYGRDGVLRRVFYKTQVVTLAGADRTISNFSFNAGSQCFNESGVITATLYFSDLTVGIVRGLPPGYSDPPLPGRDFWFNNAKGDANWHTKGGSPPTNWEDQSGSPRSDPPGDVDVNNASVFVPSQFSVVLDQRAAPIGSLELDGSLTVRQPLTLNFPSVLNAITVDQPAGAVNVSGTTATATDTTWLSGALTLSGPVLAGTYRSNGLFSASSGTIADGGGNVAFENHGTFEKNGAGSFDVAVPFHAVAPGAPDIAGLRVLDGTLSLHGGGTFEGDYQMQIAQGATLSLTGAFTFGVQTTVQGTAQANDVGTFELGSADTDATVTIPGGGELILQLTGQSAHLNRGQITGGEQTTLVNNGRLDWIGGRIAVGPPTAGSSNGFKNTGTTDIQAGSAARQQDGHFVNAFSGSLTDDGGAVIQEATVEASGVIENEDAWGIIAAADILDPNHTGRFINTGKFGAALANAGAINIDVSFENTPTDVSGSGVVQVGFEEPSNVATTVTFRGTVTNLQNGKLQGGVWDVEPDTTLAFPATITHLASQTEVRLYGGTIPQLLLATNEGFLKLGDDNLTTPGALVNAKTNHPGGEIWVQGDSVLTVNGDLTNRGRVVCESKVTIHGDLLNEASGSIEGAGVIEFDGDSVLAGKIGADVVLRPTGGSAANFVGVVTPGYSPGKVTIDGASVLGATATLDMEVAGTTADTYDILAVTGNAELGGTLLLSLLDHFIPDASDTFPIVQAGSISGAFANVANGERLGVSDGSGSFVVNYGAGSTYNSQQVVLSNWQPAAVGAPLITTQPATQSIAAGGKVTLSVVATGSSSPLHYQWRFQGQDLAGATSDTLTVSSAQSFDAGFYSVVVSDDTSSVSSRLADLSVEGSPASTSRLLNLSTRAETLTGDNILIPGFVVSGTGTKKLLIRAVGPTLSHDPFNIATALDNPRMVLKRLDYSQTPAAYVDVDSNDDWMDNANAADIDDAINDLFAFQFQDDREAALLVDLAPGQYTVFADGVNNATGVAIVEFYDADAPNPAAKLINISNRGFCGVGDQVMIPGFVISSEGPKTLLIRVVGPTLAGAPFNVPGTMADPKLEIFAAGSGTPILTQDNWGENPDAANTAQVASDVSAFALADGSADAAFVVTLPPGNYTVVGSATDGVSTGIVLVEVYVVP